MHRLPVPRTIKGRSRNHPRYNFTRYAQAIPTKNQTARTTARVLFDNLHYGFPARIHSDQGQCFESNLIKELCTIADVGKSRTTPYHPMGNGQVERFNQTLLQMLGTLEESKKSDWKAHVPSFVHALLHPSPVFRVFCCFFLIFKAVTINSYKEDNCFTAVRKRDKVLESGHLFVSRII